MELMYVCVGNTVYGTGDTIEEAVKNAKKEYKAAFGNTMKSYYVKSYPKACTPVVDIDGGVNYLAVEGIPEEAYGKWEQAFQKGEDVLTEYTNMKKRVKTPTAEKIAVEIAVEMPTETVKYNADPTVEA